VRFASGCGGLDLLVFDHGQRAAVVAVAVRSPGVGSRRTRLSTPGTIRLLTGVVAIPAVPLGIVVADVGSPSERYAAIRAMARYAGYERADRALRTTFAQVTCGTPSTSTPARRWATPRTT
jgi:hypothetical protein